MKILGVCGSSGSGKSTLCRFLSAKGCKVFDCDEIYHGLISKPSECLEAIVQAFGRKVVNNGALDRSVLREIVFGDQGKLSELNRITHAFVIDELEKQLERAKKSGCLICVIDAPMFFEAKLEKKCDLVCGVVADEKEQIRRICQRDGITESMVLDRLHHQLSPEQLKARCDEIFFNDGDLNKIEAFADHLIQELTV